MINLFKKTKKWTPSNTESFKIAIKALPDEEKCKKILETAKELLNSGLDENITAAEELLLFACEYCFDFEDDCLKAKILFLLGELYEKTYENYSMAYEYYKKYSLFADSFGGVHSTLLRSILLKDNLTYSQELEEELKLSYGEADLGLRTDRLYENLGSLIVAKENGNDDALCNEYIKRLKSIVKAEELFFLDLVFRKDTVRDVLFAPQRVLDYINEL